VSEQDWTWWQNALIGKVAPIHDGDPQAGYYRGKRKGQPVDSAIAYWMDTKTGAQRCHMDGKDYNEQRALEIWPYVSKHPVSIEAYGERLRTGKWPSDNEAVVGHNSAPVDGTIEAMAERLDDLAREAEKLIAKGAATKSDEADQASDLANTFSEMESRANRLREDEKSPHLEAGRAVDGKWRPLIDRASDLKKRLKLIVVTPFLRRVDEVKQAEQSAAIAVGVAPEDLPQVRTTAGSSKRSTGLRTFRRAEITDKALLIAHLSEHPDLIACIQKIADGAADKKISLPGCKLVEEKRAA